MPDFWPATSICFPPPKSTSIGEEPKSTSSPALSGRATKTMRESMPAAASPSSAFRRKSSVPEVQIMAMIVASFMRHPIDRRFLFCPGLNFRAEVVISGSVEVFGCRHAETIPTLRRPASEKRQGTKSREVEHRRGRGRYGDYMAALDLGNSKSGGLESAHNLSVLARSMQKRGFNVFGPCDFK